jgi:lipopolysaccharide transport system ATP-binding protein
MSDIAIKIENLSKQYRLGVVGTGTLAHDLKRWWAVNVRGKEDPYLKIGETNQQNARGESEYVWALKDINLEVKKGEVLGIIGRNGAGKSTLLKILSRVTKPTSGTISYRGRIASLLEVGTGFHPEMTGRENIYMNGAIMGMTRAEITGKLDEIIAFAGVERYIDTPVKRYSSGMKVRLGFAVAAHLEPEILVVDEVLAVGDAEFQKKAIGKMQDVSHEQGRTVLFVSHNMAGIKTLCTSALILLDGVMDYKGRTHDVIGRYLVKNSELNNTALNERQDRDGSGAALLKAYKTIDFKSNKEIDVIISGQKVKFEFVIENKLDFEINNFEIGVSFYNKNEELMFACNNTVIGFYNNLKIGKNVISLIINRWPTSGGYYTFNIYTSSKGEIIDWIKNAGSINVETGDYYGTGKIPASNRQSVFIDFTFL